MFMFGVDRSGSTWETSQGQWALQGQQGQRELMGQTEHKAPRAPLGQRALMGQTEHRGPRAPRGQRELMGQTVHRAPRAQPDPCLS